MKLPTQVVTDSDEWVAVMSRANGGILLYGIDHDGDVTIIRLTKSEAVDLVDLIIRTVEP